MAKIELKEIVRPNIWALAPYSTARDDCKEKMEVYLDANESPFNNGVNRYPDPLQKELKELICSIKEIKTENLFIGNGSDEAIDLVYRVFCTPGVDNVAIVGPTYGMYSVAAKTNDIKILEVSLTKEFDIDINLLEDAINKNTKAIFICSPNNPTGNTLDSKKLEYIINNFKGVVVIDEAYIDFATNYNSFANLIEHHNNLIVLQTLSKAYGMAGCRLGLAISNSNIINIFNKVKYPYNINVLSIKEGIKRLSNYSKIKEEINYLIDEREYLRDELLKLKEWVEYIYKSDSNFLLVRFRDKDKAFNILKECGIIVRDRSSLPNCQNCLRISIGSREENNRLLSALSKNDNYPNKEGNKERKGYIYRETGETLISVTVNLDRFYKPFINTGLPFFNHMLEQIAYHAQIGLTIICKGDIEVDEHHSIEDVGIALGDAIIMALGDKKGIERYGFYLPMDESNALVNLDFGGRIDYSWRVNFVQDSVGAINNQMFNHFFKSLCEHLKCNLHIEAKGENDHHIIEGVFKAFAHSLKCAIKKNNNNLISSKGIL